MLKLGKESMELAEFADFLKKKVSKKFNTEELLPICEKVDVNQDSKIDKFDVQACIDNMSNTAFYSNNGANVTGIPSMRKFYPTNKLANKDDMNELSVKLQEAFKEKGLALRAVFNKLDANHNGYLSYAEFSQGLDSFLQLSIPIKEKIFATIDTNGIGLLTYEAFSDFVSRGARAKSDTRTFDNFNWEEHIVHEIREWITRENLTSEEAFKLFDKDFDGIISKADLKKSLIDILHIEPTTMIPQRIDRLFRMMDQYKTNTIQLSDFRRMIEESSGGMEVTVNKTNLFSKDDTFNWKINAIQQIGLVISKIYDSAKESFEEVSEHVGKVTFSQFSKFINSDRILSGFNLTTVLLHQLFSELDPHKKGFLSLVDWESAFGKYNWHEQCIEELKNLITSNFADCNSAYEYFAGFKEAPNITIAAFEKAVISLSSKRFKQADINKLWAHCSQDNVITKERFSDTFGSIPFSGKTILKSFKTGAYKTFSSYSTIPRWKEDALDKLKNIMKISLNSLRTIFDTYDTTMSGKVSIVEFRQCLRKLNLGLTSVEIDQIINKIGLHGVGYIEWKEFLKHFGFQENEVRLCKRVQPNISILKEFMFSHLGSPKDAFTMVNSL